jgi:NAD(P)-dependent dehydrogenase (short-subunit alcohol dehydrogenase family)
MRLRGTNVLLTGASSGIGRALAVELARRGVARLALVARRAEALESTAEAVRAAGGDPLVLPADAGDRASIEAAVHEARTRFGGLDVVIANAGIGAPGGRVNADNLELTTRVNYLGAAYTLLAAVDGMMDRRRGQLVAVSSLAALRGLPQSTEYSASKAALDTLLEGLRIQLKPLGIETTLIRPGFVDTPINEHVKSRPFLLTTADAAVRIADAIEKGRRTLGFPLPTVLAMSVIKLLPGWAYDRVAARMLPGPRRGERETGGR